MSRPFRTSSVAAVTPQASQAFGVALGWLNLRVSLQSRSVDNLNA